MALICRMSSGPDMRRCAAKRRPINVQRLPRGAAPRLRKDAATAALAPGAGAGQGGGNLLIAALFPAHAVGVGHVDVLLRGRHSPAVGPVAVVAHEAVRAAAAQLLLPLELLRAAAAARCRNRCRCACRVRGRRRRRRDAGAAVCVRVEAQAPEVQAVEGAVQRAVGRGRVAAVGQRNGEGLGHVGQLFPGALRLEPVVRRDGVGRLFPRSGRLVEPRGGEWWGW